MLTTRHGTLKVNSPSGMDCSREVSVLTGASVASGASEGVDVLEEVLAASKVAAVSSKVVNLIIC